MQFRLFFGLLAVILGGVLAPLAAQPVMRTNEKGETIIVFPDGASVAGVPFGFVVSGPEVDDREGEGPDGAVHGALG